MRAQQELVTLAGTSRPFTASTGAERTLTVSQRIEILEGLLEKLGLLAGKAGEKKLPSLSRAREVGEKRALEKEMQVRATIFSLSLSLCLSPLSFSQTLERRALPELTARGNLFLLPLLLWH